MKKHQFAHADGVPKTLWLACVPCVGSTWLSKMLHGTLGWHKIWPMPKVFARREQDLHVNKAFERCTGNVFVPHTHTKWNEVSRAFVKDYQASVVILTRNVLDNVVSTVDHLRSQGVGLPTGYIPESFKQATFEQQATMVIRYLLPWNISFYASWAYGEQEGHVRPCYVDYDDLLVNPIPELARIMAHIGESRSISVLNEAVAYASDKTTTRFNIGVSGRGAKLLTPEHQAEIAKAMTGHTDPVILQALSRILPSKHENSTQISLHDDNGGRSPDVQIAEIKEKAKGARSKKRPFR